MMKVLQRYILRQTLFTWLNSLAFFTVIILLLDLFTNINIYISSSVPISSILYLSALYIPKAMSYAVAPGLLFAVTYAISSLHSRNELVSILNSGISFFSFIRNVILLGLFLSILGFLFQEYVVIDTFRQKEELTNSIIGYSSSYNNNDVVLIAEDQSTVYYARYYNDRKQKLSDVLIIERDDSGLLSKRIDIEEAVYDESSQSWECFSVTTYLIMDGKVQTEYIDSMSLPDELFTPEDFQDITFNIQEMHIEEARKYIQKIRSIDQKKYASLLTDYYERFAFSLTPLIVVIISCSLGSRFKKNILLYSLLLCIIISVLYFVFEMLTILLAKQHFIPPLVGAWLPVVVFSCIGILLLRHART